MRAGGRLKPVSSSGLEQPIKYYESGPDSFEAVTEKQPWSDKEAERTRQIEESHVTLRSDRITHGRPPESNKTRQEKAPSSAAKVEAMVSARGRAPLEPISRPRPDTVSAAGTQRVKGDRREAPFAPSSVELEPKKRKAA